jgi:hypothetical protein
LSQHCEALGWRIEECGQVGRAFSAQIDRVIACCKFTQNNAVFRQRLIFWSVLQARLPAEIRAFRCRKRHHQIIIGAICDRFPAAAARGNAGYFVHRFHVAVGLQGAIMRWVKEVVKLNDDYKFCLGCIAFRDVAPAPTITSIRHPGWKETQIKSGVYQDHCNYDLGIRRCG